MKAAIIQARFGSSRFPGKVLKSLAGKTVLAHVIERCFATEGIDEVCCAVADDAASDPVAREAKARGAKVVRGPEGDVLHRFALAARAIKADVVMRVTSDCPLNDPLVNAMVLNILDRVEYASNVDPRGWPKGLDCEVFTRDVLERTDREADHPYDREHVTSWMRANVRCSNLLFPRAGIDAAVWRWTLDYPEDLDFLRAVYANLPMGIERPGFTEVASLLSAHPEIELINANRAA